MKTDNEQVKNVMKKIIAVFMAVVMLVCVAPLNGIAEIDFFTLGFNASAVIQTGECGANGDNVIYTYNDETGELVISGTGRMWDYDPFEGYQSFGHFDVKSVVIEHGVTSISYNAFAECFYLESISIPNSVTSIEMVLLEAVQDLHL